MDINVIETQISDELQLTREERHLQIEKMSIESGWPEYIYHAFVQIDNYLADLDSRIDKPTILSFLYRKLLNYRIILPVIEIGSINGIQIELTFNKKAIHNNAEYIIPKGEVVNLVAIRFDINQGTLSQTELDDEFFILNFPWNPSLEYRIKNGVYDTNYLFQILQMTQKQLIPMLRVDQIETVFMPEIKITDSFDPVAQIFDFLVGLTKFNRSELAGNIFRSLYVPEVKAMDNITIAPQSIKLDQLDTGKILDYLASFYVGNIACTFEGAYWSDLEKGGLLDIFKEIYVAGFETETVKKFVQKTIEELISIQKKKLIAQNIKQASIKEDTLVWIYIKNFGKQSYANLKPFLPLLIQIDETEKKVVLSAYDAYIKLWESIANNKCIHIKLLEKLFASKSETFSIKVYKEIRRLFGEQKNEDYIKCANCGFDLICPHVRDYWEMIITRKHYKDIREKLFEYTSELSSADIYYCRICGEKLMETSETIGLGKVKKDAQFTLNAEDKLTQFVWKICSQTINSVIAFQTFQSAKSIRKITDSLVRKILPEIVKLESNLVKSRTASEEDIKNQLRLLSSIYVYAALIYVIKQNPDKLNFKGATTTEFKSIVNIALNLLLNSQNTVMNKIQGVNSDVIKQYLSKAYKVISGVVKLKIKEEQVVLEEIVGDIVLNTFYKYLADVQNSILAIATQNTKSFIRESDNLHNTKKILNKSVAELGNLEYPFEKITFPNFGNWLTEQPKLVGKSFADLQKYIHDTNEYIYYQVFALLFEQITKNIFNLTVYFDGNETADIKVYDSHWDSINKVEQLSIYLRGLLILKPYYNVCTKKQIGFKYIENQLGAVFGQNGHRHKWNIYIYSDGQEMTSDEVNAKIKSGDKFLENVFVVNKKCIICGQSFSDEGLKDIHAILLNENDKDRFFNYYEFECPATSEKSGDYFHDWQNQKCRKCGVTKTEYINRDNVYFEKYKSKLPEHKLIVKITNPQTQLFHVTNETELKNWKYNPVIVSQFLFELNKKKITIAGLTNSINNLGLSEGYDYHDIISGNSNPVGDATEKTFIARMIKLQYYIQYVITNYDILRNHTRKEELTEELEQFLGSITLDVKLNTLPTVSRNYANEFDFLRRFLVNDANKNATLSNFLLTRLLEILISLLQKTEHFYSDFVVWIVKQLLKLEEATGMLKNKQLALLQSTRKDDYNDKIDSTEYYEGDEASLEDTMEGQFEYYDVDYDKANDEDNTNLSEL